MFIKEHSIDILNKLRLIKKSDCINENGEPDWPDVFFIHTFHSDKVEEHKKTKKYNPRKWKSWWDENRIYVRPAVDITKYNNL